MARARLISLVLLLVVISMPVLSSCGSKLETVVVKFEHSRRDMTFRHPNGLSIHSDGYRINKGSNFSFYLDVYSGYSAFTVVKVNGVPITDNEYKGVVYTLYNIRTDTIVTVDSPFANMSLNYALFDAMVKFYHEEIVFSNLPLLGPPNTDVVGQQNYVLNSYQIHLSNRFKQVFIQGFEEDNYSALLPIDKNYVEAALVNVQVAFSQQNGPGVNGGFYALKHRLVSVVARDNNIFAHIAIHEVLHALGLGESHAMLAELGYIREHAVDRITFSKANWMYGIHFDIQVYGEYGPEIFWNAVFTSIKQSSKTPYANLFESYYTYISYDSMYRLRNYVTYFLMTNANETALKNFIAQYYPEVDSSDRREINRVFEEAVTDFHIGPNPQLMTSPFGGLHNNLSTFFGGPVAMQFYDFIFDVDFGMDMAA